MAVVAARKAFINFLADPKIFLPLASLFFLASLKYKAFWKPKAALALGVLGASFLAVSMLDPNFVLIVKKPDNIPIVAMRFIVVSFDSFSRSQAIQNAHR